MAFPSRAIYFFCSMVLTGIPAFTYEIPEVVYPNLPEAAPSTEAFVPAGWGIEVLDEGDLNHDGLDDLLLVLKEEDPANILTNEPMSPGVDEWDANPRILAIAFAQAEGGYTLVLQNNDFLPRHEDPCIDDPLGGAEIDEGTIQIMFHFWANAGSWYTSSTKYTFKYLEESFHLVAYANFTYKRNTGQSWDIELDYVLGTGEITLGGHSIDDEEEEKTYVKELPAEPFLTLEAIASDPYYYPEQLDLSWWGLSEEGAFEEEVVDQ